MSSWKPIGLKQLSEFIENGFAELSEEECRFFKAISIPPEKWKLAPWGNQGGGFWVVGIIGETILWYNDIEDGFNTSTYLEYGDIGEYWCNQHDLDHSVRRLKTFVETGNIGTKLGPPMPID